MSVLLSAHIRNFLPFPYSCSLGVLVWAFATSHCCSFGKDKRKIIKKKKIIQNQPKTSLMKTLDFNQLQHCRVHMRSSHGLSRSLHALRAVHELTFTREGSLGIVHTNHITEVCTAVKGTGTYHCVAWKIPFWAYNTGVDATGVFTSCWMEGVH